MVRTLPLKKKRVQVYATVPRLWPDSTVVVLANGPSLTPEDVDACRGQHVVAIKDTVRLAPWAEVLYGCDAKWWRAHPETAALACPKFGLEPVQGREDVQILRNAGEAGVESSPDGLRTLRNSGGQAINLAVHLGARRIVLLGYDMQPEAGRHRWFGRHVYHHGADHAPPYELFLRMMPTLIEPLRALGVTVINASRTTALDIFPRLPLAEALR